MQFRFQALIDIQAEPRTRWPGVPSATYCAHFIEDEGGDNNSALRFAILLN